MTSRGRLLLLLVVVAPVTVLAFLPSVFGLERYVVSNQSMGGSMGKGSILLEQRVPSTTLEVGDVVTFRQRSGEGPFVTRRIVSISEGNAVTRGDNMPAVDVDSLEVADGTVAKVIVALPFVGYPFLGEVGRGTWLALFLTAGGALGMAALVRPAREQAVRNTQHVF